MTDDDDIDVAIARYRRQLERAAELAATDLDEIEDHLRSLTAELRTQGMPVASAVAEAARRLGDPRAVAREHVRVRTAFGAPLSWARALSVAALMLPFLGMFFAVVPELGVGNRFFAEGMSCTVLLIALLARVSWARPILLGGMAFYVIPNALSVAYGPVGNNGMAILGFTAQLALVAFLCPWHRRELTAAGTALALQVWAYCATSFIVTMQYTRADGTTLTLASIALVTAAIASAGTVLRARWSGLASCVVAVFLAVALVESWALEWPGYEGFLMTARAMLASAIVAAVAGGVLAWRTARTTVGTFAHVLR